MRARITREPGTAPLTYTIPQAADALGVGINTLRSLVADGRLHSLKLGARVIIPISAVDRLLNKEA